MQKSTEFARDESLVQLYLDDIGQHPLIDAHREVELGRTLRAARDAQAIIALAQDSDRAVNAETEAELAARIQAGEDAHREFTQSNLRLVVSIARRFPTKGTSLLDIIQEGNTGLMKAVDKFDERKGFKFSTYATFWIRQAISRGIAKQSNIVHIPHPENDQLKRYATARQKAEDSPDAKDEESILKICAEELGQTVEKLRDLDTLHVAFKQMTSLDKPIGEDDDMTLHDYQADRSAITTDTLDEQMDQDVILRLAFEALSDKEKQVITLRYFDKLLLKDIAKVMNLGAERVRQIKDDAMLKMRSHLRTYGYSGNYFTEDSER